MAGGPVVIEEKGPPAIVVVALGMAVSAATVALAVALLEMATGLTYAVLIVSTGVAARFLGEGVGHVVQAAGRARAEIIRAERETLPPALAARPARKVLMAEPERRQRDARGNGHGA